MIWESTQDRGKVVGSGGAPLGPTLRNKYGKAARSRGVHPYGREFIHLFLWSCSFAFVTAAVAAGFGKLVQMMNTV